MRLCGLLLSAVFAVAMTGAGFAQATLPNDDVNIANNPGSVKPAPPAEVEAMDCTCRNPAQGAAAPANPDATAAPGDRIIDCGCRKTVPVTTGTLAVPSGPRTASPGPAGIASAPSR
jgi:hypothetical protein